jgi:uncharacterized membrane protein YvbJ
MNKKTKIIIAIVVILLVLVGIFIVINYNNNKNPVEPTNVNKEFEEVSSNEPVETGPAPSNTQEPANQEEPIVYRFNEEEEAQRETNKEDLKQMAFAISERFGSYSNEGNFGNISDLKI